MSTDFDRIYFNQSKVNGRFRIADSGLGWKASTTGGSAANKSKSPYLLPATELSTIQWSRGCRGYELKINTKNQGVIQLDGFSQDDFSLLKSDFHRRFGVQVEHKEHSLRGWNWGKADLARNELVFSLNGKPTFEIPYSRVNNTNLTTKNEVGIEFNLQDTNYQPAGDELVEMRLYIPGVLESKNEGDQPSRQESEEGSEEIAEEEEKSMAEAFYEELKEKADIGEAAANVIVSFQDIFFATPRGRYDVDMYKDSIRLRGKTYEYKLQYKQVQRIISLPRADDIHHLVVLSIDPPLRQGQTTYPFLVLQFQKDEETEVQLNLDDEEYEANYKDKLKRQYDAKTHIVISHVLKGLTDRQVIVPGEYRSKYDQCAVSCSYKANEGYLYPLDNAFLFLTKPTLYIPFSEVSSVNISRAGQSSTSSRTFDMEIVMHLNRGSTTFGNISKEEQQLLEHFLKSKNMRVKNEEKEAQERLQNALASDSDDGDINMGSAAEDDESVDEDFHASSGDEEEVAEEFDSDAPMSDEEDNDEKDDLDVGPEAGTDADSERPAKRPKTD